MSVRILDRPPEPRLPEDARQVVRLYKQLRTVRGVARKLDRSPQLVRKILREEGVELRNLGTRDPGLHDLYIAWRNMVRRCDDPTHGSYQHYGARAVGYAATWADWPRFRGWALVAGWQPGLSLLLRDQDQDHSPANCYWGTRSEMLRLRTRIKPLATQPVTAFGEVRSAWAWAKDPRCKVSYMGLLRRLRGGWPSEDAITLRAGEARPAGTVEPRDIGERGTRLDWKRATALYRRGARVADIAARLGCADSTIYLGLRSRGVYEPRVVKHRRIDDGPLYATWDRMRQICQGKYRGRRDARTPHMEPSWRDYGVFRGWAYTQGYRPGLCLVRVDLAQPYRPANCRFVRRSALTSSPQAHKLPLGTPRYLIRALGTEKGLTDWSRDKRCSVTAVTIARRLRAGWRPDDAITAPPSRPGSTGHSVRTVTAFGQTKGITEWTRDRRCKVGSTGLALRLDRGIDPQSAVAARPYSLRRPEPNAGTSTQYGRARP